MKESKTMKRVYEVPFTRVLVTDASSMICASVGVIPGAGTSTGGSSSSWGSDETHEGGTIFFGEDDYPVTPSKKGNFTMDED